VDVHVIENARPGRLSHVDADVQPVRLVGLLEHGFGPLGEHGHFVQLLGREARQRADVAVRDHHEMTVVVREQVEDDEAGGAGEDDEGVRIGKLRGAAEDAPLVGLAARHVGQSPRAPETIHDAVR
jgi:hypothetical protein